jgi:hypothetical protein
MTTQQTNNGHLLQTATATLIYVEWQVTNAALSRHRYFPKNIFRFR